MTRLSFRIAALTALVAVPLFVSAAHATPVSLPLTTGGSNKLDLGFFAAGTTLQFTFSGNGDMVDSRYQTVANGSMFAPGSGGYEFANPGASYPAIAGGDGINHYVGGGANYDFTGSGFGFAGTASTDTTDPTTIRMGSVVGTFALNPVRTDWIFIGTGATVVVPTGGANLYLAVQDTVSGDNHGTYTGNMTTVVVPEAGTFALVLPVLGLIGTAVLHRRKLA